MNSPIILQGLTFAYTMALLGLSVYGFLGLVTLVYYLKCRHDVITCDHLPAANLPTVTIQLPLYNERLVATRLIEAAVHQDYPPANLQIQVVDDSTDETAAIAASIVARYKNDGVNIEHLHREQRTGYKAGALAAAHRIASGEFIVIFDADFVPASDFLKQTIPHFLPSSNLGAIQARWGHLNTHDSPLTAAQAIALDKHFTIEQLVRHRANLFPKFNGSAGIWRRTCLDDAGGWQHDTLTEDLCLSTRAVLKGWDFRFLDDVVAAAELPASILAYKNQQARWAAGSTQCLLKYGKAIVSSTQHRLAARFYALLSMSAYASHLFLLLLLLLSVPLVYFDIHLSPKLIWLGIAGIGQPLLLVMGQYVLHSDWRHRLRHLPALILIVIGIAPNTSRAILRGLFSQSQPFIRTPKGKANKGTESLPAYKIKLDGMIVGELFFAIYAGIGLILTLIQHNLGPLPFLTLCTLGFSYVAYLSLKEIPTN